MKHYKNPNRENKYPSQLAEDNKTTIEFVRLANLELLQERKIELNDITG